MQPPNNRTLSSSTIIPRAFPPIRRMSVTINEQEYSKLPSKFPLQEKVTHCHIKSWRKTNKDFLSNTLSFILVCFFFACELKSFPLTKGGVSQRNMHKFFMLLISSMSLKGNLDHIIVSRGINDFTTLQYTCI